MKEVKANSDGQVKIGSGTLYGSINRMLSAGMIEESGERPDPEMDDQHLCYYCLSGIEQRILRAEAEHLAAHVAVPYAKHVLLSA